MYYLLETDYFAKPGPFRTRPIKPAYGYEPSDWLRGKVMKPPSSPIQVQLWERGGGGMAEAFLDSIPIFREDLVQALSEAGVDNLQVFPAVLVPPRGEQVGTYRAVNILGLVKCADLEKSEYDDITGTGMIAMSFRKLVIDEKAARDLPLFRLAEAVASIVVHERVKAHLDTKAFRYLSWRALVE